MWRDEKHLGLQESQTEEQRTLSLWHEDREIKTTVAKQTGWKSPIARFSMILDEAGWDAPVSAVLLGLFGISVLCEVVLFVFTGQVVPGVCVAGAFFMVFWFYLNHCVNRRRSTYELQFVDALDLAARSSHRAQLAQVWLGAATRIW
jgi:Flp pilus assembly protein TadB